jgi:2-hydroxychromene-2-carboxylate isomerase
MVTEAPVLVWVLQYDPRLPEDRATAACQIGLFATAVPSATGAARWASRLEASRIREYLHGIFTEPPAYGIPDRWPLHVMMAAARLTCAPLRLGGLMRHRGSSGHRKANADHESQNGFCRN